MNIGECYICSENDAPLSSCNCKNMYIHDTCLITTIKKLNKHNCTICKQPYANVTFKILYKLRLSSYGFSVLTTTILCIMSLVAGSYQFYIYIESGEINSTGKNSSIHNNNKLVNTDKDISLFISASIYFCSFMCTCYLLSLLKYMHDHNLTFYDYHKITIPVIKENVDMSVDTNTDAETNVDTNINLIMDNVVLDE